MRIPALVHRGPIYRCNPHRPGYWAHAFAVNLDATPGEQRAVAILKVGDAACHRREGESIAAGEHLMVAVANGQRASAPGANQEIFFAGKQHGERERALQSRQHTVYGGKRLHAASKKGGEQNGGDLSICFGFELFAVTLELKPQLAMIFDDAIVHHRNLGRDNGVRVALDRQAVRRPARMRHANRASQRRR